MDRWISGYLPLVCASPSDDVIPAVPFAARQSTAREAQSDRRSRPTRLARLPLLTLTHPFTFTSTSTSPSPHLLDLTSKLPCLPTRYHYDNSNLSGSYPPSLIYRYIDYESPSGFRHSPPTDANSRRFHRLLRKAWRELPEDDNEMNPQLASSIHSFIHSFIHPSIHPSCTAMHARRDRGRGVGIRASDWSSSSLVMVPLASGNYNRSGTLLEGPYYPFASAIPRWQ